MQYDRGLFFAFMGKTEELRGNKMRHKPKQYKYAGERKLVHGSLFSGIRWEALTLPPHGWDGGMSFIVKLMNLAVPY